MSRSLSCWSWLLAPLLGLAAVSGVTGQGNSIRNEGTEFFRRLLHERGYAPLKSFDKLDARSHQIVIVLGSLDCIDQMPVALSQFLNEGGSVLLASDRRTEKEAVREQILRIAGVQVTGQTFVCKVPGFCYRQTSYCPIVQPIRKVNPNLFGGIGQVPGLQLQVATNLPSALKCDGRLPNELTTLAYLPAGCVPEGDDDVWALAASWPRVVAVGGPVGKGRLLILADHSIFINEMMLPPDNNNVEFADNCLTWLRGEHDESTQVLFVEDGRIRARFDVPLKSVGIPEGLDQALLTLADRRLAQVSERLLELGAEDAFNRAIFDRIPPGRFFQGLLLWLSLALVLYLSYRILAAGRYRLPGGLPRLLRVVREHTPAAVVLEQREQSLLAGGNLWETARSAARQCFADAGWPLPDAAGGGEPRRSPSAAPPEMVAADGWWGRRRRGQQMQRLWRLATSPVAFRVSAAACREAVRDADEIRAALHEGRLRLREPTL